jgi:hypothetical protein
VRRHLNLVKEIAMRLVGLPMLLAVSLVVSAADCDKEPPSFEPLATTFEGSCRPGETIVKVMKGKSPVVKLHFAADQSVTIATGSKATSGGGNGWGAQVCIWRSWDVSEPCGSSRRSPDGFNAWGEGATCTLNVPKGEQYVRAFQTNRNADEVNTTMIITCR